LIHNTELISAVQQSRSDVHVFKGAKGQSFDGESQVPIEEDGEGNGNNEAEGVSHSGFLFFNKLNPDDTNTVFDGDMAFIENQFLSCDPLNKENDDAEDDCIDENYVVKTRLFYQDPANERESLDVAEEACAAAVLGPDGEEGGGDDVAEDDIPACSAELLFPIEGADIRLFVDKFGDGIPRIEAPGPLGNVMQEHADGVYSISLNTNLLSGPGEYDLTLELFANDIFQEVLYDLTIFENESGGKFFILTEDEFGGRVSGLIIVEAAP